MLWQVVRSVTTVANGTGLRSPRLQTNSSHAVGQLLPFLQAECQKAACQAGTSATCLIRVPEDSLLGRYTKH